MKTLLSSENQNVVVIPHAVSRGDFKIPAAVYCRVSTKSENQEESLENQILHYKETVGQDPRYELTEIYYDFGMSGFKENRPGFQKMMEDSREGKFQMIITKSITRFARNTATVLNATRELKKRGIGVFFELQNIHTLSESGELLMTLYAAFGQAESEENRTGTKMAIQRKIEKGEPVTCLQRIFGYSQKENGEIVPDANAKWVMEIFEMAADGFSVGQITNYLNSEGVKTQTGSSFFRATVSRIITNEEYKGDFVQMKHFIDDHRRLRSNNGERDMLYYQENHLPIVPEELWKKAQSSIGIRQRKKPIPEAKQKLSPINYPYRHQLFCGKCGHRLMRTYTGGKYRWICSGKERFSKDFCSGVSILDEEVKSWGVFLEKRYITEKTDRGRIIGFIWEDEDTWKRGHTKRAHRTTVPELTEENYPYKDRIFCKYCGSRLRRIIGNNGSVTWICNNFSRNGKNACKGIRVPDQKLQSLRNNKKMVYIGKEIIDGKECYGYSSKPDKRTA